MFDGVFGARRRETEGNFSRNLPDPGEHVVMRYSFILTSGHIAYSEHVPASAGLVEKRAYAPITSRNNTSYGTHY